MDIRNFFGGGGGAKPKATKKTEPTAEKEENEIKVENSSDVTAQAPKKKVKRIIEDDDDDDEEELEFGSDSTSAVKTGSGAPSEGEEQRVEKENIETFVADPSPVKVSKVSPKSAKSTPAPSIQEKKPPQQASIFSIAKKSTPAASTTTSTKGSNSSSSSSSSSNTITSKETTSIASSSSDIPSDLASCITWKPLAPVPYAAVAAAFDQVSATSSRLEKESILTTLYRCVALTTPADLEHVVYLTSNTVYPAFAGLELGIGDALLVKAVVEATGRNRAAVQAAYKEQGDLGLVACQSRQNQSTLSFGAKPKALTARFVLEQLRLITNTTGGKSMDRKVGIIKKMMVACQGDEAKYIVRALQGKLRIGIAMQTVLAHAFSTPTAEQIALSKSLVKEEEEGQMDVVADEDGGDQNSENEDEEKKEDAVDAAVDFLKEQFAFTEEEKLDGQSASGNEKLCNWVKSLSMSSPEEAIKLKNAGKDTHTGRYRKITKEERDDCAVIAVKRAFSECPSLAILSNALLSYPIFDIHQYCLLTPGVPVAPMLAKPTKQIAEVLKRLNGLSFTMEYKYDGERAQVHLLEDGSVKIFSRNSEDNSQVGWT